MKVDNNKIKTLSEVKKILTSKNEELKRKYHIKRIGIFGSYAYGNPTAQSDLDLLVEFEHPIGFDFVTLADELEEIVGLKVDLVSANAIKERMMQSIKENLIYV